MKSMLLTVTSVVACAISISGCATSAGDASPAAVVASADAPQKICKRMPVMGSNFPKTVCSTAEEWAEFDRKTRESVDSYDNDRKQGNTQGSFEN